MGLVVQNNMPALNANNKLSKSKQKLQKSMEKLASGCSINRASDDASGLAVSEKMRNQITALDTDVDNCEDGSNMIQVAEGAMAEVAEMLIRCSALAGKASNGILGDQEREIIQDEIDQIHEEIDRIQITTKFNEIKVFGRSAFKGGLPDWMKMDEDSRNTGTLGTTYTTPDGLLHAATIFDISSFTADDVKKTYGKGFSTTCCSCHDFYSLEFTSGNSSSVDHFTTDDKTLGFRDNYIIKVGIDGASSPQDIFDRINAATGNTGQLGADPATGSSGHYSKVAYDNGKLIVYDDNGSPGSYDPTMLKRKPHPDRGYGLMKEGVYTGDNIEYLKLKIGDTSTAPDILRVEKPCVSTNFLGIDSVYVLDPDEALDAVDAYKEAGVKVSQQRGLMGAYQNRLEHTINVHTNTSENVTAAKSRISDTDMAKEYMNMTTHNILNQATVSLFSQANAQPESILSLLQQ